MRVRMNYLDSRKAEEHTLVKSRNSGETVHPRRGHETGGVRRLSRYSMS